MPEGGKKKEKKKHLASDSDKGENSGRKRGTSPDERPKKYLALAAELSARGLPAQHARENLAKEGREGDGSSVEGDDSARRSKSPHVPHGEGEKSPPMPVLDPEARDKEVELNGTESPFPFPPGFDAAGFLQWLRKNLTTQESTPSVAASTSRTGVVGSGRKQPGNLEDGECSEEADSSESEKDEGMSFEYDNPFETDKSEVPEHVRKFVADAFTNKLSFNDCKERMEALPTPSNLEFILKVPQLDSIVNSLLQSGTASSDKSLRDCHEKLLFAAHPLVELLASVKGSDLPLSPEAVCKTIENTLLFLGTASYMLTQTRREFCGKDMKPEVKKMITSSLPTGTSPDLFGNTFVEKLSTLDQARRTLNKAYPMASSSKAKPTYGFRGNNPRYSWTSNTNSRYSSGKLNAFRSGGNYRSKFGFGPGPSKGSGFHKPGTKFPKSQ